MVLLYIPAWMKTLAAIKKGYKTKTEISKCVRIEYAHTYKIMKEFENMQLVTKRKEGRRVIYTLTSEGEKLAGYIQEMVEEGELLYE